ncbi:THxN family PEP-CTERM protein [Rhodovulum marinum]|nr:THxN family PEP-CTERM protein [Rhodovulum marinum]
MSKFKAATAAAAITAAAFVAQGASAASFYVDNVVGTWTNVQPGSATNLNNVSGDPATLSWGNPAAGATGQSQYIFNANSPSGPWAEGALIDFGQFTHNNQPITGTSITSADLEFAFQVDDVAPITASSPLAGLTLSFTHNETPNVGGGNCCNDEVTATISSGGGSFTLGSLVYTFSVLGFSQDGGSSFVSSFSTVEGQPNTANLYGKYSVAPVPLPAAAWMLIAGLGGLGVMARRRKAG